MFIMVDRIPRFFRKHPGISGYTLVETLVVLMILTVLAGAVALPLLRASQMERGLREEAYVRTQLTLNLERMAREISVAKSVVWEYENAEGKRQTVSSPKEIPANRRSWVCFDYPQEAGGVSLETNRYTHVQGVRFSMAPEWVAVSVSNIVNQQAVEKTVAMYPDGVFIPEAGNVDFVRMSITNITPEIVDVSLAALVPQWRYNGDEFSITVEVSRLVRMWNYHE